MSKIWILAPLATEDFINNYPEYSRVVLQLLYNRGLKGRKGIEDFLNPDFNKHTHDPMLFKDMEKAIDKIIEHIKAGNKITVYGDYDADGVTASVLLVEALAILKAQVDVYIPDRVAEGYGLNRDAINEIAQRGTKLIVTVDNGIRNHEEITYAKEIDLEIIVTDHHIPPEDASEIPNCLIINPTAAREKYPFRYLSGAGIAYKLACAVIDRSTLDNKDKDKLKNQLLDLVAIGTVADCVSLLGENRILVKKGLEVLNQTKRIGLLELIKVAGLDLGGLNAWNISFQIGPRLNAAGRLDHASTAFELLITQYEKEAKALAVRLNESNMIRQKITDKTVEQAEEKIKKINENDKILIAVSPSIYYHREAWNEGVVGLAASRICDKYYKPTLVITNNNNEIKGSGRSIEEFNIVEAIEGASEYLGKYGGHPLAIGITIKDNKKENLEKFSRKIKKIAIERLKNLDLQPKLKIDAKLKLNELDEKLISEIEQLAPFGQDNLRPNFVSYGVKILDILSMGLDGQHIKLRIKDKDSKIFSAVGFGQSEVWQHLNIGDTIDIVYYAEINKFNGRSEVQLKIVDIKRSDANNVN